MTLARRPILLVVPLAALVIVLALATNVLPLRQIVAQRQEIAATEARLAGLVESNDALEAHVAALQTPAEVERIAREDLGYVRPGEEAYVVIDPTPEDAAAGSSAPAKTTDDATDDAGPAWWSRVWDYITGRDLVDR